MRGSFDTAHAAITHRCGPVLGKRQIEQAVVNAAADIGAFYAARIPEPCTASTVLVISADAKGIVMRPEAPRPTTAKAAARQGNWGGTRLLRTTPYVSHVRRSRSRPSSGPESTLLPLPSRRQVPCNAWNLART